MKNELLFDKQDLPRTARKVLMHYYDIHRDTGMTDAGQIAKFECRKCGTITPWKAGLTVTDVKRGIPCEACND